MFGSAYVWRNTADPVSVLGFMMGFYAGLPIGFFTNGKLLKRFRVSPLYGAGFFGQCLAMLAFVLWGVVTFETAILGGFAIGITAGVYWSSRILLTLHLTHNRERDLFFALDTTITTVLSMLMPLLFGLCIQRRFFIPQLFDEQQSYTILLALALLGFGIGGYWLAAVSHFRNTPHSLAVTNITPCWRHVNLMMFVRGLADSSVTVIAVLLPLIVFHGEEGLGRVQCASAIVTAIAIYLIGRSVVRHDRRLRVLCGAIACMIWGASCLLFTYSKLSVIAFSLFHGLGSALSWATLNPLVYQAIETLEPQPDRWLGYIFSRELHLNSGRLAGGVVIGLLLINGYDLVLRVCPLPLAVAQIIAWFAAAKVERLGPAAA